MGNDQPLRIKDNDQSQFDDDEFVTEVNENEILKIQIFKLDPDGNADQVWDLGDYLENNKDKTSQLVKNIERKKPGQTTKEQYVVVMLEKILEELTEVQFGYLRVNVAMKPISLRNNKLTIDEKVKFYFWVNISGVCTIADPQTN